MIKHFGNGHCYHGNKNDVIVPSIMNKTVEQPIMRMIGMLNTSLDNIVLYDNVGHIRGERDT